MSTPPPVRTDAHGAQMAKPKKYETNSGSHVSIYGVGADGTAPIEVPAGGVYETEDPQEQEALDASPEVSAVKDEKRPKDDKDD